MYPQGIGHRQSQPTSMETGAQRFTRRAQDTDSRSPPPWRQELKGLPAGHRTQTVAAHLHGDRSSKVYPQGTGHRQSQPTSMETGAQRCTRRAQDTDSRSPPPWRQELKGLPAGHRTQSQPTSMETGAQRFTRRAQDTVAAHLHGDRSSKVYPQGTGHRQSQPTSMETGAQRFTRRAQDTVAAHLHGDRSSKVYPQGTGHRQSQPTSMETGAQRFTRRAQDTDSRSPPPWRQELKGVPAGHRTQTVAAHLHGDRSSKVYPQGTGHRQSQPTSMETGAQRCTRRAQDTDSRSPPPWRQEL